MNRVAPLCGLLVGWLLLAAGAAPAAAANAEQGFPLVRHLVPSPRAAGPQSFDIARDPAGGTVYVANTAGVLVYDGAWWRLIPIGEEATAFSVASGARGRVGVGGVDDFGFLAPDSRHSLRYVSLLSRLPAGEGVDGQVHDVIATAGGFLYLTGERLFRWDGRQVEVIARFPGDRPFTTLFLVGGTIYAWTRDGLFSLEGNRLLPVPGGEVFRGRRVDLILPAESGLLVSVRSEGLFTFERGRATAFAPAASRWAAEKRLLRGTLLPDGRWALGSILGGMLLLRPDGDIDGVIDTATGLSDDFVAGAVVDHEGALWIALNNGIARVEVSSPLTVIDRRAGLSGSVYTAARHAGRMWVGTAAGAFTLNPRPNGGPVVATPETALPPAVWSLLSLGEELLVGTAFGIYRVANAGSPGKPWLIPGSDGGTPYALLRSKVPGRVWVGTESGLAVLELTGGRWSYRRVVDLSEIHSLVEGADGTGWCNTARDGIVGIELAPGGAGRARRHRLAAGADTALSGMAGSILALSGGRIWRFDEARRRLAANPATSGLVPGEGASQLVRDARGRLWIGTQPPTVAERVGSAWRSRPLAEIPARTLDLILPEPDGVVWLGGENGLFRYGHSLHDAEAPLPAPRFSRVTVGRGDLLFGGAPGAEPPAAELPADVRHLRIEFAPLAFRAGLSYETRLDPDRDWSPTTEAFVDLPRLSPGRYVFRVRTLGSGGVAGPEARWEFRIEPPWYGTLWATALWIGAAIAGIAGYVRLRNRALRHRAARLEARVEEQTVELRQRVEELRRAQDDLQAANVRLEELSLQDELTGLANRRRLQSVLASEWSRARRNRLPIAFILLDIDHFKQLNDTRGHREGDQCLKAVGHFLAQAADHPGSVAARYGGEEFAILLPNTDLPAALAEAENLRRGFEQLGLPHEAAPAGVITASFGVAATIPEEHYPAEALIEAADAALYRAKNEGRNRVRAAGIAGERMGAALPH